MSFAWSKLVDIIIIIIIIIIIKVAKMSKIWPFWLVNGPYLGLWLIWLLYKCIQEVIVIMLSLQAWSKLSGTKRFTTIDAQHMPDEYSLAHVGELQKMYDFL